MTKETTLEKIKEIEVELNIPSNLPPLSDYDKIWGTNNFDAHLERYYYIRNLRQDLRCLKGRLEYYP